MTVKMVRTQVYLPKEIYKTLKEQAEAEGIAMATQIREALALYVVEQKKDAAVLPPLSPDDPLFNLIGIAKDGPEDGSENHDNVIYGRDWE